MIVYYGRVPTTCVSYPSNRLNVTFVIGISDTILLGFIE